MSKRDDDLIDEAWKRLAEQYPSVQPYEPETKRFPGGPWVRAIASAIVRYIWWVRGRKS